MIYHGYLVSHGGNIRSNNEDNGYLDGVYRYDDRQFYWECECSTSDNVVGAVFDGVGGEHYGEAASRLAAETLSKMGEFPSFSQEFRQYIREANRRILEYSSSGLASTAVLLSVENNQYCFCNIGDSRAYLFRNHNLKQVSSDHNLISRMVEEGILSKEQAKNHPERHTIYQYLGLRESDGMILDPFISGKNEVSSGDLFLLCSDGLTDMVEDREIEKTLRKDLDVRTTANILLQTALDQGGKDNITILLLKAI